MSAPRPPPPPRPTPTPPTPEMMTSYSEKPRRKLIYEHPGEGGGNHVGGNHASDDVNNIPRNHNNGDEFPDEFSSSSDKAKEPIINSNGDTKPERPKPPIPNSLTLEEDPGEVSFWELYRKRWLHVITYCAAFASFGVSVGFLGPTVLDLGCRVSSDQRAMAATFTVQLLATLVGSICSGFMARRVPAHILLLVSAVGVSVAMFVVPACRNMAALLCTLAAMGWCMGTLDCVANLQMLALFQQNVGPFMQALHFSYGLGAFVSPFVASLFLLNHDCSPYIDGRTLHTPVVIVANTSTTGGAGGYVTVTHSTTDVFLPPMPAVVGRYVTMSRLHIAFYILGALQMGVAGLVGVLIHRERRGLAGPPVTPPPGAPSAQVNEKASEPGLLALTLRCCACGPRETIAVATLAAALLFVTDGLQSTFADYIYSYAARASVPITAHEGATLDTCFWGVFALGRLLAIPAASRLTARFMLLIDVLGCLVSLLLASLFRTARVMIYICTCLLGLSLASATPSALAMAEQFVHLDSNLNDRASTTTWLVTVAALGEALAPLLMGKLLASLGAAAFLVQCLVLACLSVFLYIGLLARGQRTPMHRVSGGSFFLLRRRQPAGGTGEASVIRPAAAVRYYSRMSPDSDTDAADAVPRP